MHYLQIQFTDRIYSSFKLEMLKKRNLERIYFKMVNEMIES